MFSFNFFNDDNNNNDQNTNNISNKINNSQSEMIGKYLCFDQSFGGEATYSTLQVHGILLAHPKNARVNNDNNQLEPSDLVKGVYEGGFKLWECAVDLMLLLRNKYSQNDENLKLHVMDMGCGHGLPGILCAQLGMNVIFQDYNEEVLIRQTMKNVSLNVPQTTKADIKYLAGDWSSCIRLLPEDSLDILLAAETIYSTESFQIHLDILSRCLKTNGIAFLSAKRYYFGVGGGSSEFQDFLYTHGGFQCETIASVSDGASNIRDILAVQKKA